MRTFILLCCSLPFLLSCSLPRSVFAPGDPGEDRPGRLMSIRIERWDTLRFSGLLGVRETASGLDYVLLDATGVKLLQAEVAGDGGYRMLQESGPLHRSRLPQFLAEALARIYLQEPDRLPCTGSWLYRLCREAGEGDFSVKSGHAGPFTVWRSTGHDPVRPGDEAVVYHQPWVGVKVKLARMETGR